MVGAHDRKDIEKAAGIYVDPKLPGWLRDGGFDLVLDVGANRGQFAQELFAAGYGGRIVSFEPTSTAHAHLAAAVAGNPDWQVAERCALGAARGESVIHIAGNLESSSLLDMLDDHVLSAPESAVVGSEKVAVRTLDEAAAGAVGGAGRVFLKLDVQGYEDRVLDGAATLLPRIAGLQMEASLTPLYDGELLYEALLGKARSLGFRLFWTRRGHADPHTGRMLQLDMILFRDERNPADAGQAGMDVFIVIHDQDLVLACEAEARFAGLPGYRYVFVGDGATDRISHLDRVVIARDLPFNIEEFPDLVSYTAWYAVAKNGLATKDHVCLLEYDVGLAPDFHSDTLAALRSGHRIVGFVPVQLIDDYYLFATPWLTRSVAEVYGINAVEMIGNHLAGGGRDEWTSTSNAAMRTADLDRIVDWIMPLTCIYRHDREGAHVHERTLKIFCLLNGIENFCVPDVLVHLQEESHGIPVDSAFSKAPDREASAILPPIGSGPATPVRRHPPAVKSLLARLFGKRAAGTDKS